MQKDHIEHSACINDLIDMATFVDIFNATLHAYNFLSLIKLLNKTNKSTKIYSNENNNRQR